VTRDLVPTDAASDVAAIAAEGVAHTSALAAERYRIEGMIVSAHRWPRDEERARTKALVSCRRPAFAERATYEYPRGGATVSGPSVYLARELARTWGNIHSGSRVVDMDDTWITVEAFANDLETNRVVTEQSRFRRMIMRRPKGGGRARWQRVDDEREIAELLGRNASRKERNCILRLMPVDMIEECVLEAERALLGQAEVDLRAQPALMQRMVAAFEPFGVGLEQILAHLGRGPEDRITSADLARLRAIHKTIKDGEASAADYFDVGEARETPEAGPIAGSIAEADIERPSDEDMRDWNAPLRGVDHG
jgi:hypothetical protein